MSDSSSPRIPYTEKLQGVAQVRNGEAHRNALASVQDFLMQIPQHQTEDLRLVHAHLEAMSGITNSERLAGYAEAMLTETQDKLMSINCKSAWENIARTYVETYCKELGVANPMAGRGNLTAI